MMCSRLIKMEQLFYLACIVSVFISGCTAPTGGNFKKPTIFTNPLSYLDSFPLNSVSEEQLIEGMGLPDKVVESNGKKLLSYELGEGYGKRQYVYEVIDGVVVDVRYNDQGPYNNSSALQRIKGL